MTGWESGSRDRSFTKPRLLGLRISAQTWKRIHQEGNYPISLFSEVSGEKLIRARQQKNNKLRRFASSLSICSFVFPLVANSFVFKAGLCRQLYLVSMLNNLRAARLFHRSRNKLHLYIGVRHAGITFNEPTALKMVGGTHSILE